MSNFMVSAAALSQLDPITLDHENDQINKAIVGTRYSDWIFQNIGTQNSTPGPAPAPQPAAPTKKVSTPALLIIEEMMLYTVNGDLGVLTPPISSFYVTGNTEKTYYVHKTVTQQSSQAFASSALDSSSQTSSDSLSQDVKSASSASSSTDTFDYKLDSSVQVHGDVGLGSFDGSGSLAAKTDSTAVHADARDAVDAAVQKQALTTKTAISQQDVSVSDSNTQTSTEDTVESITINNLNNPQSITYGMCRVAIEKVSALCLTDIKLGLYDAREDQTRTYGLYELDSLVNDAIDDPQNRAKVSDAIKKWLLQPVFDCNSVPQNFVSEVTENGVTYLKVNQDAQTSITLPRTDGTKKSVVVPGIALSREYRVMPTDIIGAAKLVAAANM